MPKTLNDSRLTQILTRMKQEINRVSIAGLSVNATTLPAGSNATASFSNGTLSLGIPRGANGLITETVSGSTPNITAESGVRYICGEVSTLTISLPASGDVEVIFESGSTATTLTVTPPSGITAVKWPSWFDPTDLDANATYDMIITNGEFGVVTSWT